MLLLEGPVVRGVARFFQRGGGHTGSNNIVVAFSPWNIVGCFLKKRLTKGGHRHPRTPPPPSYTLGCALASDCQPKIQAVITAFSVGEVRRQPALSNNTEQSWYVCVGHFHPTPSLPPQYSTKYHSWNWGNFTIGWEG